jgi:D-aspartate ligase
LDVRTPMLGQKQFERLGRRGPAAVVCAGSLGALAVARSLGKQGVPLLVLSKASYLRSTRYGAGVKVREPNEAVHSLLQLSHYVDRRPVLFTDDDSFLAAMVEHRQVLESNYLFTFAQNNCLLTDKSTLADFALRAKVVVPQTWTDAEQVSINDFPVVVKPIERDRLFAVWPKGARKAYECYDREALDDTLSRFYELQVEGVIQELIPGDVSNLYCVTLYRNEAGRVIVGFVVRKLRQYPVTHGTGTIHVTCDEPRVVKLSVRLLETAGYVGVAMIEYKYHEARDEFVLIEVNGRFPLETSISNRTHIDFPFEVFKDVVNPRMTRGVTYTPNRGTRWVHRINDIRAAISGRRNKIGYSASFERGHRVQGALLDFRDVKPVLGYLFYATMKVLRT